MSDRVAEIIALGERLESLGVRGSLSMHHVESWTAEEWEAIDRAADRKCIQCWIGQHCEGRAVADEYHVTRGDLRLVFYRQRVPTDAERAVHDAVGCRGYLGRTEAEGPVTEVRQ